MFNSLTEFARGAVFLTKVLMLCALIVATGVYVHWIISLCIIIYAAAQWQLRASD